jgi:hypothetical protein
VTGRTLYERLEVIRWIVVIFLALVIISLFTSFLQKLGVGRLPGDIRFRALGREWFLPVTSTLVLSGVASLIARYL